MKKGKRGHEPEASIKPTTAKIPHIAGGFLISFLKRMNLMLFLFSY